MTGYTSGKWQANGKYKDYITVSGQSSPIAKVIGRTQGRDLDEHLANARLIATAPDMFHELLRLREVVDEVDVEIIDAILANATGTEG